MHECERIKSLPSEEILEKAWKNPWGTKIGVRWESLGEKTEKYRERYRMKWVPDRTGSLNSASSKFRQMQVSKGIETPVKEGVEKMVVDSWGIEEVSRNNPTEPRTEARSIHQVSRSYRRCRPILDRSTRYRKAVRIAIRKSWRSSTDSKVLRRYQGGVEPAFKTSFSRWEKHRHECNPTCNSTNDPINILNSQNHLSTKILSTWIFQKKHTHTH